MTTIRSPFKFLDAFTLADREVFFGRDKETEQLYDLVFKTSLLLIYGASGTGKTSLIQCGLASKFDGTDWLPLWIRRDANINDALKGAINRALPTPNTEGSVNDAIQQLYQYYLRPVFLIFDQFEELFIFGTQDERDAFVVQIKTILDKELPCTILIVIREEYLGQLYPIEKEIQELFDFRMRIEPMDAAHVKEVLNNSFSTFNIAVEPPKEARYDQIIENVSRGESGIKLPYLQVYLDMLYRENFKQKASNQAENTEGVWQPIEFTADEITTFGTIDKVLDKFIDEQIQHIQAQLTEREPTADKDTVRLMLVAFASEEGTKRPIRYTRANNMLKLEQREQDFFPESSPETLTYCLTAFENARLIRSDGNSMELAHDSLAALIAKRRTDEERQRSDIKRQITSMYQNFSRTDEYLSQKQITVFEDTIPYLNLEPALKQFFDDSKKFRTEETIEELEKEKQRNEELQKALKEAKILTKQMEKSRLVALGFAFSAFIALIIALWFYFDSTKQTDIALAEKAKTEKLLKDVLDAQKAKEMVEFKIMLQNMKKSMTGKDNNPDLEQLKQFNENKTKYLYDAEIKKLVEEIESQLSNHK